MIDGACGSEAICDMWKNHYCNLLNSSRDFSKKHDVQHALEDISNDINLTVSDISKAVKNQKMQS